MERYFRYILLTLAVPLIISMVGFFFQWSWATQLWPFPSGYGIGSLSSIFIAAICAAIAAPLIWIVLTRSYGAAAAGGLDLVFSYAPIAIFMFQSYLGGNSSNTKLLLTASVLSISALFAAWVFVWGRQFPTDKRVAIPRLVQGSFAVLILALIVFGTLLVLKTPNILPWSVTTESSVVYGWVFLGASFYFMYALRYPSWQNATGQLLGFLAYDLILIVPFIRHFADIRSEQRLGLIVYTFVVVYSGVLAIYYLFIHKETRLFKSLPRQPIASTIP